MALSRSARLGALATAAASFCLIATAPAPHPGADGVGDPYFPQLGNGGFDVRHYGLDVAYNPDTDRLDGRTTITARATQNLSSFNLDLQKLEVTKIEVNSRRARFTREGDEIRISPRDSLRKNKTFTVTVTYGGVPEPLSGPIVFGSDYGWMKTTDGVFVACEPNAASTWFPSSDHPGDKAAFDIRIKAPKGLTGVSNGRLVGTYDKGGQTVAHWRESKPMATYLATATIGKFDVRQGTTPGASRSTSPSTPSWRTATTSTCTASRPRPPTTGRRSSALTPSRRPARSSTTCRRPASPWRPRPSRSTPPCAARGPSSTRLAHQWFGDSVSVEKWKHIWLNEGFATYSQWLWTEHKGTQSAHDAFLAGYNARPADSAFWQTVVGDPQRDTMFASAVYQRGAMTLQVLRERIGDKAFFKLLPAWTKQNRYGNANTDDFIRLAEKISGKQLDVLFQTWLFTQGKPAL